jgi:hypothetical protein
MRVWAGARLAIVSSPKGPGATTRAAATLLTGALSFTMAAHFSLVWAELDHARSTTVVTPQHGGILVLILPICLVRLIVHTRLLLVLIPLRVPIVAIALLPS